jgi:hypothetical protein
MPDMNRLSDTRYKSLYRSDFLSMPPDTIRDKKEGQYPMTLVIIVASGA